MKKNIYYKNCKQNWNWSKQNCKEPLLTCSLISCNCCCNFCISLLVSRPPLFIRGPCRGATFVLLVEGLGSSSTSLCTSVIVPKPPQQTAFGTSKSIWALQRTHFFMIWEQLSHAIMWPQGLNKTDAFLSEHTRHSSICKENNQL